MEGGRERTELGGRGRGGGVGGEIMWEVSGKGWG